MIIKANWEEQIVLVRAYGEQEAIEKRERLEISYQNVLKKTCYWTFEYIGRVYQLLDEQIEDGCKIFSRFLSQKEDKMLLEPLVN